MLSTLEIVDKAFELVNIPIVQTEISGEVAKMQRALNSELEDIVINCLPTSNTQLQDAVINVNVFVPDITGMENAGQNKIANVPRLRFLASLIIPIFTDRYFENCWFDVQTQTILPDDVIGQHFINIRVGFKFINL